MRRLLLRQKLVIATGLSGLVVAVLLSAGMAFYLDRTLSDQKLLEIKKANDLQVQSIKNVFDQNIQAARLLAAFIQKDNVFGADGSVRVGELDKNFADYVASDDRYLAISLLDNKGIGIASSDKRVIGQDYSVRNYFEGAIKGDPSVQAALGATTGQIGIFFAHPVMREGSDVAGVLVVKVDVASIGETIFLGEKDEENSFMFADENGVILASTTEGRFLKSLGTLSENESQLIKSENTYLGRDILSIQYDVAEQAIRRYSGETTVSFYGAEDGENEVLEILKIGSYPFFLVAETDLEKVGDAVFSFVAISALFILLGLLVISFAIYKSIFYFIRPIWDLKTAAESISGGDFSAKVDIRTNDEFSDLGSAFNLMGKELADTYKHLDKKVAEKTKEAEVKSKDLDAQKEAILNILGDVEVERLKMETLAQDLEKFKLAVDNTTDHIVITDPEGVVLYGNKAVEIITGYKLKDAIGKKAGKLWSQPMPKEYYARLWDTIKNKKKPFQDEIVNIRKGGEKYHAIISIAPVLNKDGNIEFFVGVERDITEQKNAEEQIAKVLNDLQERSQKLAEEKLKSDSLLLNIGDGIIATDQDGNITTFNESAEKMLGFENKRLVGRTIAEAIKFVDEKDVEIPLFQNPTVLALSTGKKFVPAPAMTYYLKRANGKAFPAGITVTPYVFNQKIIGTIMVFRDITIEKNIDQAKTEFVSLASHQLRTPLTAISWYTEMLLAGDAGKLSKEQADFAGMIAKDNRRMVDLVNSLLNVSRLELGVFVIEPQKLDLVAVAKEALDELKVQIKNKKMQVETAFQKDSIQISADPKLLHMIFQNYLSNAVKYTQPGGKIKLAVAKNTDEYLITVSDNGYGIPKKDQSSIFTKLFRADNIKTKDTEGTGLGLYIVKQIAENSNGRAWFDSTEGKGTTFYIALPLTGMPKRAGTKTLN
ncbi:MAG: PAS domain S-box protein [bacterium]